MKNKLWWRKSICSSEYPHVEQAVKSDMLKLKMKEVFKRIVPIKRTVDYSAAPAFLNLFEAHVGFWQVREDLIDGGVLKCRAKNGLGVRIRVW